MMNPDLSGIAGNNPQGIEKGRKNK